MPIEVVQWSMRVGTRPRAAQFIDRVGLDELDQLPRRLGQACLNGYLLVPVVLPGREMPCAHYDLIRYLVGCAAWFLKGRLMASLSEPGPCKLLLDAEGTCLRIGKHTINDPPLRSLLTWPRIEAEPWNSLRDRVRVLLEYIPPTGDDARTTASRVASAVEELGWDYLHTLPRPVNRRSMHDPSFEPWVLEHSLSALESSRRCHAKVSDVSSWASRQRHRRRLFGVWNSAGRTFVHPAFQFDATGASPKLPGLLSILETRAGMIPDGGGWTRACWFYHRDRRLAAGTASARAPDPAGETFVVPVLGATDEAGQTPAEVFGTEPDRVIALAQTLPTSMQ